MVVQSAAEADKASPPPLGNGGTFSQTLHLRWKHARALEIVHACQKVCISLPIVAWCLNTSSNTAARDDDRRG
jgi:hypothetical protein